MNWKQKVRLFTIFFQQQSDSFTSVCIISGLLTSSIWNLLFWQASFESTILINILIITSGLAVFIALGVGIYSESDIGSYGFNCDIKQLAFNLMIGLLSILIGAVLILSVKYGIASLRG